MGQRTRLRFRVSFNGFVSGEDESSLSGELSFSFDYEENGDVGEYSITPSGLYSDNYDIRYVKGKFTVNKAPSKLTKAPEGRTGLIYDGKAQELSTAGTAEGGTLKYSLKEKEGYSEDIPTAKEAGDYTVWYKVFGDGNHNDTDTESLSVSIAEKKEESADEPKPETVITPSENKAMDVRTENVGDYRITYAHQVPFPGKGKLTAESFGLELIVYMYINI